MKPEKLRKILAGVAKADMDDLHTLMNAIVQRRVKLRERGEDE